MTSLLLEDVMDLVYLGLAAALWSATLALLFACARLQPPGGAR